MDDARLVREFITNVDVYDAEWDVTTYEDVLCGQDDNGDLIITDTKNLVVAIYARGAWFRVEFSRAPRLESTGDTDDSDGEIDDDSATEPHAGVPRDGA